MSQKKQPTSRVTKSKENKIVYFKKEFKLMIHNITLEEEIRSTIYSLQAANYTSIPNAQLHITMNSIVDITTIDVTSNDEEKADLEVILDLSHFAKSIKNDLAIVKFQVNKQKILASTSVNFYTQPLANRKGTIEYKFVSKKITQIDEEEFVKHNTRRDEIIQIENQLAQNPQLKRLIQILDAKDIVIGTLQRKIASLIEETRRLTHNLQQQTSQQRKRMKQGLNFNLNVNASNNLHMKLLNQKLSQQNTYLNRRIDALQQKLQQSDKQLFQYKCQNNILQIQIGKKSIIDAHAPTINFNPAKSYVDHNRQMLHKIQQQEYDQELEIKSKMADSFFLPGDESSIKSKLPTGRRLTHTLTVNPGNLGTGVTPRGNSKGRTKSVIDPTMVSNLQQQLQQSKLMDHDQVQMELNELKNVRQNMQNRLQQAVPQQDGTVRYPRLQAAIKSSYRVIQRLNEQKSLVQQKLKRREQQIQNLRRQLDQSKANFKNFQKQLRQRSSNAKQQFDHRMAAIKMQTEMKMAEMRKLNRFSDYQTVTQTQKRQIQIQTLKYNNDFLQQKYEQAINQLKLLQLQKASQHNKYRTTQVAINKQKQMYKSKYYQMQDSFTKQQQQLSVTKQKAKLYQAHVHKIQQLQKNQQNLKQKIQKQQKQIQQQKNKIKRYEDKFTQIQPKWEYYRQMEHQFDIIKRKNINLNKLNQRFQSRMQQMKKFAVRLQNAYYQKKQKHQTDFQFDQQYKKQLQQRLEQTFKKLRLFQRQFYQEQINELNQNKKELVQFYYKRIVDQNQRIEENPTYNQADKQKFKNQKQHQINIVKEGKLDQIDRQIKKYQSTFGKLVVTEQYLPKGLNQKISYLQEKMRKFELGQFGSGIMSNASQSVLKNTVDRLNESVKDRQSQITELKKTMGKMSDGNNLLKINNIETTFANNRKSMIQQIQKNRQIFTRSFDELKKANVQLLKQKTQLQIEVQRYRIKNQRVQNKLKQRQSQLQRMAKKSTEQFQRKVAALQKALSKKSDQNLNNKRQKQQFKEQTEDLITQINKSVSLIEMMQNDRNMLEAQNEQLKSRLQKLQQAEKSMITQINKVKAEANFNQKTFTSLLQQRNEQFSKIQRIKSSQIQKLIKTISEYEYKLQTEVSQVLHMKQQLQLVQQKCNQLQGQLQQTKVSYNVVNENYHKVEQDSVLKIHQLEQTNQQLQRSLMQMAQEQRETEMELQQGRIKLQSLQKQLEAISGIKQDLTKQQSQFLVKKKQYQQIIEEQNQKLSSLQNKYRQISDKVHQVERENQSINYKFIEKQSEVQDLREKLNKKYDQLNQVKSMKFDSDMKVKQLNFDTQQFLQVRKRDEQHIAQLEEQVEQLKNKIQTLQTEGQQQQLQKSRLKPPPKTNLMQASNLSDNDLGASIMKKSTKPTNQIKKSAILSKKQIRQIQRSNLYIDQAQSIRLTHLNTPTDFINVQENGPNRFRIWTVNEAQQDLLSPQVKNNNKMQASHVNVDLSQDSNQDANLDSDMSARQQQVFKSKRVFDTMVRRNQQRNQQSAQQSQVIYQNIHQAQIYGSNQLIQQYVKEIQSLKEENQKLVDEGHFLEEENHLLKEKIGSLTGNVEQSQKKNFLASAFGLTGGLLMRQQGQRSSVEKSSVGSNHEHPHIPTIKIKSGINVAPAISSKQAIKIEDSKSFHGSLGASRQSSLVSPVRSGRQSPRDRSQHPKNPNSGANLARSSVGDIISTRKQSLQQHIEQQNDRVRELQLVLDEVEEQNKQLRAALQEENGANEKLMEEIQVIQESQEEKHRLVQQKTKQIDEVTQYYEQLRQDMQKNIQKLVEQGIEKQSEQVKLMKTFQSRTQQIQTLVNRIQTLQRQLIYKNNQIMRLSQEKDRSYREYRKYEEDSELEILRLKQQMTHLGEISQQKHNEVQLIAEDYFELNNRFNTLEDNLKDREQAISRKEARIEELTKVYSQASEQLKKTQQQKRSLRQQIHQLQNDLVAYQNSITDVNKATSLTIKKYQIKLNTGQQQKMCIKQKLSERQTTIQSLKHTIALYNEQTNELKQLNKQLTLQLQRTEKQLKQIMRSYETQFTQLNLDLNSTNQNITKFKTLISDKELQIFKLTKIIHSLQCDTRAALNSEQQIKQTYQKYKSSKHSQIANLLAQIQLKNDQYEKIKSLFEKESQQFISKQKQYMKRLSSSQQSKKTYKQKLVKYQSVLQQLQKQLEVMSLRPTKEHYDQQEFQNELYKNRIEELQQMLREFAPQAHNHKHKHNSKSQQALQMQFKKYKMQKERQLDDLSSEIDKYGLKINQLEEANFMLKKQIQKLRQEMTILLEQNDSLQEQNYDLKEDLTELKEEIEFYKGKRIENLSKLLNQTM